MKKGVEPPISTVTEAHLIALPGPLGFYPYNINTGESRLSIIHPSHSGKKKRKKRNAKIHKTKQNKTKYGKVLSKVNNDIVKCQHHKQSSPYIYIY